MGKASYKLQKHVRQEEATIQAAARKRGLWGSIGSTLGSILAMAVTGGAAAPLAAGLLAGGLSYAGGKIGSKLAKDSGAKLEGGKFLQGTRSGLESQIEGEIGARAMKSGLTAGMTKLAGAALKYGKEGFEVAAGGTKAAKKSFEFGDIFKSSDPKALADQTGLGKLVDFKGSWLGGKMDAAKAAGEYKTAMEGMGETIMPNVTGTGETVRTALGESQKELFGKGLVTDTVAESAVDSPDVLAEKILRGGKDSDVTDILSDRFSADIPNYRSPLQGEGLSLADARSMSLMPSEGGTRELITGGPLSAIEDGKAGMLVDGEWIGSAARPPSTPPSLTSPKSIIGDPASFARSEAFTDQYLQDMSNRIVPEAQWQASQTQSRRISEGLQNAQLGPDFQTTDLSIEDAMAQEYEQSLSGLLEEEMKLPAIEGEYVDFDPNQLRPPLSQEFQATDPLSGMQTQMKNLPASFERGNLPVNYPAGDDPAFFDPQTPAADMSQFADRPAYIQQMPANLPQSFPVRSPDLMQNMQSGSEFNVASPDFVQPIGQRGRDLQKSVSWHKRLFPEGNKYKL